jgi:hypothetical protein
MSVLKWSRVVTAAIAAIVVHGSGNGILPSNIGLPSAEYGYFERSSPGKKR